MDALTAEADDATAKIAEVLAQAAQEVVSRVNAGRRKRGLSPVSETGASVPPGAVRHAYSIARQLLTDAFPSLAAYNGDDRKAATDAADKYLDDLAKNDADADDAGAAEFEPVTPSSGIVFGGVTLQDFTSF